MGSREEVGLPSSGLKQLFTAWREEGLIRAHIHTNVKIVYIRSAPESNFAAPGSYEGQSVYDTVITNFLSYYHSNHHQSTKM